MLSLADVQHELRRAIVMQAPADLSFIAGPRSKARARVNIHVRHFRRTLTCLLERTYPAITSLVDQRFFAFCADAFVAVNPPAKPCLFEYGGDFADFLASFEPCAALPYLPDVARLEWDMHAVFHELGSDRRAAGRWVARGIRLLQSPFPIHRIWQVARGDADGPVALNAGGTCLVIYQDDDEVTVEALSPAQFVFLSQLRVSRPLVGALAAARSIDPSFRVSDHIPTAVAKLLCLPGPHKGVDTHE